MSNDALTGKTIGQYTVLERLGEGGMGRVYRAHHAALGRDVALKIMSPEMTNKPGYLTRFEREAKVSGKLDHPNITTVYDFGSYGNLTYIAMKLLTGGSLELRLRQRITDLPSIREVAKMLTDLASALDYAHGLDVIHRDIKPGNIMFDAQGKAYLVDFGIAKMRDSTDMNLTGAGVAMGSPSYMPPEQWRGESATAKSDQYALAVTIYNTLTGRLPFEADNTPALMYKHLQDTPKPITEIRPNFPMQLVMTIGMAMAKDPARRYPTCSAFAEAFVAAIPSDAPHNSTLFFTANIKRTAYDTYLDDPWMPLITLPEDVRAQPTKPTATLTAQPAAPTPSAPIANPRPPTPPPPVIRHETPAKSPANARVIVVGLIGVLVFALIGVVAVLASGGNGESTPNTPEASQDAQTAPPILIIIEATATTAVIEATATPAPLVPAVGMMAQTTADVIVRKDTNRFIIRVANLPTGTMVEILDILTENGKDWFKIRTPDGDEGFLEQREVLLVP